MPAEKRLSKAPQVMSSDQVSYSDAAVVATVSGAGDLPSSPHAVQFYSDDTYLLDGLGRFLGKALGTGGGAIVIASKGHRLELAQRLKARGLDVALASAQGKYVALDAHEALSRIMVGAWPDAARFAGMLSPAVAQVNAATGGERARAAVFGEMVALLWEQGNAEGAVRLEQLWNELALTHSFSLLCAYPMSTFGREEDAEPLRRICEQHSQVIPAEDYSLLDRDGQRRQAIVELQQKARALETEIAARREIQAALKRREAELADFLENAVEGVQQVGSDQCIRWANKSLLDLLGYTPREYVGRRVSEFYVHRAAFDEFWRRLMERKNIFDYPVELRCKDGTTKHVLIHSNGLWRGAEFIHTRCFIRDVTEHKRMEEALRRSERLAATGRLAASIAHEINNPLESLTNLFYLIQSHAGLDETARFYAGLADKELRRVAHITRQMLGFYRESARPVPVSVAEILDSVLEAYVGKLQSKSIAVEKKFSTGGVVEGFPFELRQLFANLVGNAIEASAEHSLIRLRLRESTDWSRGARRGVRVAIADNGFGIPPECRARVFDAFFTTKGESGTGLGLWVCRGIVQKHDGTIRFRSSTRPSRRGTLFSVFLPAAPNF